MIQDLGERKLYNHYEQLAETPEDWVFCFDGDKMLVREDGQGGMVLPRAKDLPGVASQYLFRIEEERYFLTMEKVETEQYTWTSVRNMRRLEIKELAFAGATAYHLYQWYRDNQFCGRCGSRMDHGKAERVMECPHCGNHVYPKIAPAVIVAVTNGDKILLTKYNGRAYKKYALIAGFTEIGETAEETVAREVMEEAGLRVRNIRYYKSQPWGVDSNLLFGFFCDVDGDDRITMDADELSVAEWVRREDMDVEDDGFSLTREMMGVFRRGEEKNV